MLVTGSVMAVILLSISGWGLFILLRRFNHKKLLFNVFFKLLLPLLLYFQIKDFDGWRKNSLLSDNISLKFRQCSDNI